jgi:hypothetical protein
MSVDTPPQIERDKRGRPLPPPGVAPTSLKMALVVPVFAVLMLGVVIVSNVVTSDTPPAKSVVPIADSSAGLTVASINPFAPFVAAGEPVDDILNSVVIPDGSTQIRQIHTGGQVTSFDVAFLYSTTSSQGSLYSFFHSQMAARGWKIFSTGAPTGGKGIEILAQKAGTDGWYWEEGVIIHPTTFNAQNEQITTYTIRLYQASSNA